MERLKGAIARCSRGTLGLITEPLPVQVTYPDGTSALAYVGFHIGPSRIGEPWSSREPKVERWVGERALRTLLYLIQRAQVLHRHRV